MYKATKNLTYKNIIRYHENVMNQDNTEKRGIESTMMSIYVSCKNIFTFTFTIRYLIHCNILLAYSDMLNVHMCIDLLTSLCI